VFVSLPQLSGMQIASFLHRVTRILPSVACMALRCFSTLPHKRHDSRGKKSVEHKMCVLIFSTILSETFLILRGVERDVIINVQRSSRNET
jgi:hypothetical protein